MKVFKEKLRSKFGFVEYVVARERAVTDERPKDSDAVAGLAEALQLVESHAAAAARGNSFFAAFPTKDLLLLRLRRT